MKKFTSIPDNSAAAFASQRKEFYEQAIELMKTLDMLAYLLWFIALVLFIEHIAGWF